MISICIPVYNRDITLLVSELHNQCKALDSDYEIILIDDASDEEYRLINKKLVDKIGSENIKYEELKENIGRAAIRNRLAHKASFPYLLYIDNDTRVDSSLFVTNYLATRSPGVVCYGGYKYEERPLDNDLILRWLYGKNREEIDANVRKNSSRNIFSTYNFLIDKRIILLHPFDEDIREYGYEDIVFMLEIIKHGYSITHIDNPLVHEGLITSRDFIDRTESALKNLANVWNKMVIEKEAIRSIRILDVTLKLKKWHLTPLVAHSYRIFRKLYVRNLIGKNPSLLVFDLYKLGYLCNLKIRTK